MLIGFLIWQWRFIRDLDRERRRSGHRYPPWAIALISLVIVLACAVGWILAMND
jgi:hypothetical protein